MCCVHWKIQRQKTKCFWLYVADDRKGKIFMTKNNYKTNTTVHTLRGKLTAFTVLYTSAFITPTTPTPCTNPMFPPHPRCLARVLSFTSLGLLLTVPWRSLSPQTQHILTTQLHSTFSSLWENKISSAHKIFKKHTQIHKCAENKHRTRSNILLPSLFLWHGLCKARFKTHTGVTEALTD